MVKAPLITNGDFAEANMLKDLFAHISVKPRLRNHRGGRFKIHTLAFQAFEDVHGVEHLMFAEIVYLVQVQGNCARHLGCLLGAHVHHLVNLVALGQKLCQCLH